MLCAQGLPDRKWQGRGEVSAAALVASASSLLLRDPPCPSRSAGKAPTYSSALEHLGVQVAELHVSQGRGARAVPSPHTGVHGGHPLQEPQDAAVTLEGVPTEVPGARSQGGATTWDSPLGAMFPGPSPGKDLGGIAPMGVGK